MINVKIKQLYIKNFRGIKNLKLDFNDNVNTISGKNGTGKSSVLDAIKFMFLTRNNNTKFISNDSTIEETAPSITMQLFIDEQEFILATSNKSWKINDIDYKANNYRKRLLEIFQIQDLDLIISRIDPQNWLEENLLSEKSGDSKKLRDSIIKAVNLENEDFNEEKFNSVIEEINYLSIELKELSINLKHYYQELENLKQENQDIDFNVELKEESKYDYALYSKFNNQVNEYNKLEFKIDNIQKEIKELDQKKKQIKFTSSQSNNEKSFWTTKDIILTIITFGIYYFLVIKKRNDSINQNVSQNFNEIRNISDAIKKLLVQENILFLEKNKINYVEIKQKLEEISSQKVNAEKNNEYHNRILNKYQSIKEKIVSLENKITQCNISKHSLEEQKFQIVEKISQTFKNAFKSFQIFLTNENDILIRKDGIDFKKLNYSSKKNIITEINDFLKPLINVNIFSIMDNTESLNNIEFKNNNQYIFCKVTEEENLKLNGQDIN